MAEASLNKLTSGGTLRSRHKTTKAHRVCPNRKQKAVSGKGIHRRTN